VIVAEADKDDDESDGQYGPDSIRSDEYTFDTEWTLTNLAINQNAQTLESDAKNSRLFCFAQSLKFVIRDGLKSVPNLAKALTKCKALSRKSHHSTKIVDFLNDVDNRLSRSNATR
jgi:hypothetical protein